jgi:Cysteine rich repeat
VRWPAAGHGPEQRIELILDLRPTRFCGWPPAQSTRKVTDCLGSRRIQMTCVCRPFLRAFCLALLTVAAIGAAGDAFAQKPSQTQINAMRQSCRSDYMAHCSSVPTGGAPALNCLKQNLANLSPGCQTAVKAIGSDSPAAAASATPPSQAVPAAPAPITSTPSTSTPSTSAPSAPTAAVPPTPMQPSAAGAGRPSQAQLRNVRQSCGVSCSEAAEQAVQ